MGSHTANMMGYHHLLMLTLAAAVCASLPTTDLVVPEKIDFVATSTSTSCRKISLKSWKGDYLHRSVNGLTTWHTGKGNEWTIEQLGSGKISLKSWKGDYLHRPNSANGLTTWPTGIGNEWTIKYLC